MPGVVNMEDGGRKSPRTDHDRNAKMNGANGVANESAPRKEMSASNGDAPKGGEEAVQAEQKSLALRSRWNDLPEEINHVTEGFISLSKLLTRLAQSSHNTMQMKIVEFSQMPVPAAAINGNAIQNGSKPDDASQENMRKKAAILQWAQEMHGKWVKALVITEWSRKADQVSKVIDLNNHLFFTMQLYRDSLEAMMQLKREMSFAGIPSPDLKTALHILSTGSASWISDQQYIEPPPLTADEQVKWVSDVDTLLSMRLNLDEYEKIPEQFRHYEVDSGRVIFRVEGEFEVDLTIADEDFEKQFWFIDFRFAFSPATETISDSMRAYLEGYVNDILAKDGLQGCYQFLHEFVLTCKINELKRQALQLSKTSWTGSLVVEPLHRALAIQYWIGRSAPNSPKSWVLVAIDSDRKRNPTAEHKSSRLVAKWYRHNKEVVDVDITLDTSNLSAEALLKTVIGRHTEFILKSIHDKLMDAPRFKKREAAMELHTSTEDPALSSLTVEVGQSSETSLAVETMTGLFAVKPHSKFTVNFEQRLNAGNNQVEDGVGCLEHIRCSLIEDEVNRQGGSMGWLVKRSPLSVDELRTVTKVRESTRTLWLQKRGWSSSWYVVVFLSLRGDEWWLLEAASPTNRTYRFQAKLPLNRGTPPLTGRFWQNLMLLTTGMIMHSVDMRQLHQQHVKSRSIRSTSRALPIQISMPTIEIALSSIFPAMVLDIRAIHENGTTKPALNAAMPTDVSFTQRAAWANDVVIIKFKGVRAPARTSSPDSTEEDSTDHRLTCLVDVIIKVKKPSKLATLKGLVAPDVSYHPGRGEFCVRVCHAIGEPILTTLKSRIKAIDRFVSLHEALDKTKGTITSDSTSLTSVNCTYGNLVTEGQGADTAPRRQWTVALDLSKEDVDVRFEKGNPHLRVLDLAQRLVNAEGGIEALLVWLPVSLPALQAIDTIESSWDEFSQKDQGRINFCMKMMDWMSVQYTLTATTFSGKRIEQSLKLDVRIRTRSKDSWWHIWRPTEGIPDQFDTALKAIWRGKGEGWQGLATGAAGKSKTGVVSMLTAVDNVMKGLVGNMDGDAPLAPSPAPAPAAQARPQQQQPPSQQQAQQLQQIQQPKKKPPPMKNFPGVGQQRIINPGNSAQNAYVLD